MLLKTFDAFYAFDAYTTVGLFIFFLPYLTLFLEN